MANGSNGKKGNGAKRGPKPWAPTDKQIQEIATLAAVLNQTQVADYFGITVPTFHAAMGRDPRISLAYKEGRAKAITTIAGSLLQAARSGNLGAMCFYLKTQAGWRETSVHEITGADGGPIQVEEVVVVRNRITNRISGIASRIAGQPTGVGMASVPGHTNGDRASGR